MAEQLTKQLLRETEDDAPDCKVGSAGLFAVEDDEPSEEAVEVLEKMYGIEPGRHRARQMTEELASESDCIIAMEEALRQGLIGAYPEAESKTYTLLELAYGEDGMDGVLDIEDPYGGDMEDYRKCAAQIRSALERALPKLHLAEELNSESDSDSDPA